MKKHLFFVFLLGVISATVNAQFDSLYAVRYPEKLGISIFQSKPSYNINISQKLSKDSLGLSPMNYSTLNKNVTGFGFFYDKISLFVGFKTPLDHSERIRKGRTNYTQLALAITGVKIRIEASYRNYKGFYDNNSVNYIPDFSDTTKYFQNTDMKNHSLRLKAFYFFNKKKRFSYGAAYVNNVRQLKSAGSLVVVSNLYLYGINAPTIVSEQISKYYVPWNKWNSFSVTALTAGLGYTHTFTIFKRAFLNVLFSLGVEEQHVVAKSIETGQVYNVYRMQLSAYDLRSSLGFNSSSFYISLQNIIDGNSYRLPQFDVGNVYVSTFLNIGYRFKVKTPSFYKKIQTSKFYRSI